jgi:NAD(P)H-hydrate epimerase
LLDGILGTGIRLPVKDFVAEVLARVNTILTEMEAPPSVVAVDCPSGVDCDTGEAARECIPAELTVTMAAVKSGLLKFPAYNYVGKLELVGIGLPEDMPAWKSIRRFVVEQDYVQSILPDHAGCT